MKKTALYDKHLDLGAKMVEFAGFMMPIQYEGITAEHLAVRNAVGLFDVSHMGEFIINGPHALDLIQKVTSNDASKLVNGGIQYSTLLNEQGGIVDDLLVYRWHKEAYYLVVNAANIQKDWTYLEKQNTMGAELKNISDDYSLLALQGPLAQDTLQKITTIDLASIPYYHYLDGVVAGIGNIIVSNTGYTGAGGYELYVPNENVIQLWDALMNAGKPFGIKACGLAARDTLRLEKGFCLYGNELNDNTNPYEAGLGWITKIQNKECIAKTILLQQKEIGLNKKLIGFHMLEKAIPRSHYKVYNEAKEQIGEVTSGTLSPILQKGIGMAYVQTAYQEASTPIFIQIRDKYIPAEVIKIPFV